LQIERIRPVVVLIEDAELHRLEPGSHDVSPANYSLAVLVTASEECSLGATSRKWLCTCRFRRPERRSHAANAT
jgi:hypothetical protein